MRMAKNIVTQFGEVVNYDHIVTISTRVNWEDAEIDDEGNITPDFEMIGTDDNGNVIPFGIYPTMKDAENAVKAFYAWLGMEAYAVYEVPQGADA